MKFLLPLLLSLVCSPALAQIRLVTNSGDYFIDTSSDPPLVLPITQVVDVTGQDPAPQPPPPGDLADRVGELAEQANDPESAKVLGEVYGETAKQVEEENLTPGQGLQAISLTTEVLLSSTGNKDAWQPFLSEVKKEHDKVRQESPAKVAATLKEIQKGLQAVSQEVSNGSS